MPKQQQAEIQELQRQFEECRRTGGIHVHYLNPEDNEDLSILREAAIRLAARSPK